MGKLILLLLGIIICAVVAIALVRLLGYAAQAFGRYKDNKVSTAELDKTRSQLNMATMTLIKIAAEDAGNPALEAKLALDEISRKEVTR